MLEFLVKSRLSTANSFRMRRSEKLDCKSFIMRSSETLDLKPCRMSRSNKSRGVGALFHSPACHAINRAAALACPPKPWRRRGALLPRPDASTDHCRPIIDDRPVQRLDAPTNDCLLMTVDSLSARRRDCPSPDHCVSIRHFGGSLSRNPSALRSSHEAAGTLPLGRVRRDPSRNEVPAARGHV